MVLTSTAYIYTIVLSCITNRINNCLAQISICGLYLLFCLYQPYNSKQQQSYLYRHQRPTSIMIFKPISQFLPTAVLPSLASTVYIYFAVRSGFTNSTNNIFFSIGIYSLHLRTFCIVYKTLTDKSLTCISNFGL